jgi:hypothetical protein
MHACTFHIFGSLVMIWLHICSSPLRMTCCIILRVIFVTTLIHTIFRMQICSMRNFIHYAQILIDIGSWLDQSIFVTSTTPRCYFKGWGIKILFPLNF